MADSQPRTFLPTLAMWLILIAFLQGSMLYLLHQILEQELWLYDKPQWLVALYSMTLVGPTLLLLALTEKHWLKTLLLTGLFTFLVGALGFYIGLQARPLYIVGYDAVVPTFVITITIASFKGLMYIQQWSQQQHLNYRELFQHSWRNFLTLGLALAFMGGFALVLFLWGALFKTIGIDFFSELFEESWFLYPTLSIAFGLGILMFRRLSHIIDTIARLQQTLMKYLLLVLTFVSLLFLGALLLTGLTPLWDSGGSALILWLMAVLLFFVNAVYQHEDTPSPYPLWLHRFIYIGLACLPIYSAISCYGLSVRVEQYGWTLNRLWAFTIWGFLTCFALGYLWGILRRRDQWLTQLSYTNIGMGLLMMSVLMILNSPIADFRKWVVQWQLNRFAAGLITEEQLDLGYFYYDLARPGYLALKTLLNDAEQTDPTFAARIQNLLNHSSMTEEQEALSKERFIQGLKVVGKALPKDFTDFMYSKLQENYWFTKDISSHTVVPLDLNQDGHQDYLLAREHANYVELLFFYQKEGSWRYRTMMQNRVSTDKDVPHSAIIEDLQQNNIEVVKPEWNNLKIQDIIYEVNDW